MNTINKPIRADVVGSMLRPKSLLAMQEQVKAGTATLAELTAEEDSAVKNALKIQERCNLDIVTDGEMRRPVFCHNFVKAVKGFRWDIPGNTVIWFDMDGNQMTDPVTVGVVEKLQQIHDISVDEFAFMRAIANKPIKITIPSPTMMTYFFAKGVSDRVYAKPMRFLEEVAEIIKNTVSNLEQLGVQHIQIDAPEFGMLIDPIQQEWFEAKGFRVSTLISQGIEMINDIVKDFSGTSAIHICRGNDKNRFMARGGYDAIAPIVFARSNVDRLLLEFDSDRAGTFEPLTFVPDRTDVVLGLISTKTPILEDREMVIQKIHEASNIIPMDRLALSTQCGFASVAKGNFLSEHDEIAKLSLVSSIARNVWRAR